MPAPTTCPLAPEDRCRRVPHWHPIAPDPKFGPIKAWVRNGRVAAVMAPGVLFRAPGHRHAAGEDPTTGEWIDEWPCAVYPPCRVDGVTFDAEDHARWASIADEQAGLRAAVTQAAERALRIPD